jgi:hypothetical protein
MGWWSRSGCLDQVDVGRLEAAEVAFDRAADYVEARARQRTQERKLDAVWGISALLFRHAVRFGETDANRRVCGNAVGRWGGCRGLHVACRSETRARGRPGEIAGKHRAPPRSALSHRLSSRSAATQFIQSAG